MIGRGVPVFAIFCYVSLILSTAGPTHAHKERVIEETLSSSPHETDGKHNVRYDQEAFLGEDAESFMKLTPEESKEELGKIFHKIDSNNDGAVTMDELVKWLEKVHNRTIVADVRHTWESYKLKPGEPLTWELYSRQVTADYGDPEDEEESLKTTLDRDRRRWDACSTSKDGTLLYSDASCFLHPELHDNMKDLLAKETVEEIDKNKDGYISEDEYISDMWTGEKGVSEPDWVQSEREEFRNKRDKDKNGKLDVQEVHDWIFPTVEDPIKVEADHLMQEVDADGDGRLDKNEMLNRYDFLVGHQVTNFGEVLGNHDEL